MTMLLIALPSIPKYPTVKFGSADQVYKYLKDAVQGDNFTKNMTQAADGSLTYTKGPVAYPIRCLCSQALPAVFCRSIDRYVRIFVPYAELQLKDRNGKWSSYIQCEF